MKKYRHLLDQSLLKQVGAGKRLLLALSGGPDSTAMLLAINEVAEDRNFTLHALYVNHQFRAESAYEQKFCAALCRNEGIEFTAEAVEAERPAGKSLETYFRDERYKVYHRVAAAAAAADFLVLGHTADDLVESFVYQLSRWGSGSGLTFSGIGSHQGLPTLRPLWLTWKADILQTLQKHHQEFCIDDSNCDTTLATRNLIRHDVLPHLEQTLNPNIKESLLRAALSFSAAGVSVALNAEPGGSTPWLLRSELLGFARNVSRHKFFSWAKETAGKPLPSQVADKCFSVFLDGTARTFQVGLQKFLILDGEAAWFANEIDTLSLARSYLAINRGLLICAPIDSAIVIEPGSCMALLNEGALYWPQNWPSEKYKVRNRRPGDRIGSKKLKSLFIDLRLPWFVRDYLLVIEDVDTQAVCAVAGIDSINRRAGWRLGDPTVHYTPHECD